MARRYVVQNDDSKRLSDDCHTEMQESEMYTQYREDFLRMLSNPQAMWDSHLGYITAATNRIELLDNQAKPAYSALYSVGLKIGELEIVEINKMLKQNLIDPAQIEWTAPIVSAPKKYGNLRFCVICQKVNDVKRRESYPISWMDEYIDSFGEVAILSTLDVNSGLKQIEIEK